MPKNENEVFQSSIFNHKVAYFALKLSFHFIFQQVKNEQIARILYFGSSSNNLIQTVHL